MLIEKYEFCSRVTLIFIKTVKSIRKRHLFRIFSLYFIIQLKCVYKLIDKKRRIDPHFNYYFYSYFMNGNFRLRLYQKFNLRKKKYIEFMD